METAKQLIWDSVKLLDGDWLLAVDPDNTGREQKWFADPLPGAKLSRSGMVFSPLCPCCKTLYRRTIPAAFLGSGLSR